MCHGSVKGTVPGGGRATFPGRISQWKVGTTILLFMLAKSSVLAAVLPLEMKVQGERTSHGGGAG